MIQFAFSTLQFYEVEIEPSGARQNHLYKTLQMELGSLKPQRGDRRTHFDLRRCSPSASENVVEAKSESIRIKQKNILIMVITQKTYCVK